MSKPKETTSDVNGALPEFKGIKISRAYLVTAYDFPIIGATTSLNKDRQSDIELTYGQLDLEVKYRGKVSYVPKSNILGVSL